MNEMYDSNSFVEAKHKHTRCVLNVGLANFSIVTRWMHIKRVDRWTYQEKHSMERRDEREECPRIKEIENIEWILWFGLVNDHLIEDLS